TFFGVAKPTLGARASRQASRPQLGPQAIGAASGRSQAGGTPALPGCCVKRTLRLESVPSASETLAWLRLDTDRAHNNRKAVRKTEKMSRPLVLLVLLGHSAGSRWQRTAGLGQQLLALLVHAHHRLLGLLYLFRGSSLTTKPADCRMVGASSRKAARYRVP
ncbi:MAG: hypothetical protein L0338_10465, partial [Acidobacteria bacterium]|nr:hypothetical protein [Acidobacteriota bacterium]